MKTYTEVGRFPSSSSDKVYTVKRDDAGKLSCDCPAYRFKKPGKERTCKHMREVEAGRLAGAADYVVVKDPEDREDYRPLAQALRDAHEDEVDDEGRDDGVYESLLGTLQRRKATG